MWGENKGKVEKKRIGASSSRRETEKQETDKIAMEAPNLWSESVPKAGTTINTSRRLLSLIMSKHCVVAFVSSPAPRSPPPSNAFRIACDGRICAVLSGEARSSPVTDYYRTMAEIRPIEPRKISNKSIANDRHGGILRLFFFWGERNYQAQTLRRESQDPVHRLMPSLLTPRQLTRFSWPLKEPTLSPRRTSHT